MIFEENLQYRHKWPAAEDLPDECKTILQWVGERKNVLEVGCHTGDLSQWLQRQNCKVTGLEINCKALEYARSFLTEAICMDIENENDRLQLSGKKFDAIIFEHVIEHLADPWKIVRQCRSLLSENGCLILALPNISNADSRFNMFFGSFNYTDTGVMDKTHLRFFNQKTIRELIHQTGFKIDEYAAPWQVNPLREFIDHLPVFTKFKDVFSTKPPRLLKFSPNITDVVMMFKCSLRNEAVD